MKMTYSLIFACPGIDENGFKMRTFKHLSDAVTAFTKDYNGCIKSENLKLQGENLAKLDEGHAYADFGDITLYLRKVEIE
jgi:hypothetical protein